jgi:hypothetical protein
MTYSNVSSVNSGGGALNRDKQEAQNSGTDRFFEHGCGLNVLSWQWYAFAFTIPYPSI